MVSSTSLSAELLSSHGRFMVHGRRGAPAVSPRDGTRRCGGQVQGKRGGKRKKKKEDEEKGEEEASLLRWCMLGLKQKGSPKVEVLRGTVRDATAPGSG